MIVQKSCSKEHPGFVMKYMDDEQKKWKAEQMLLNFNRENFLQHLAEGKIYK